MLTAAAGGWQGDLTLRFTEPNRASSGVLATAEGTGQADVTCAHARWSIGVFR